VSLILDALRKANAERERGSVPSLHSQPVVPLSAEAPPKLKVRPNWLWIAIGIAVGLAVAATWLMVRRDAPHPSAATVKWGPAQPSAPGATPAGPAAPGVPPHAAAVAPVAGAAPPPAAAASTDAQTVAEPAPWSQPEERKAARPDAKSDTQVATLGNVLPAEAPVYSREQLPPHIRAELPQFAIGGSIYSANPASRSLIVNGQLFRERDRLTPELSLEEIKLKAAIFSFRGYRFEVLY
jgi:general secretion pathway protein B